MFSKEKAASSVRKIVSVGSAEQMSSLLAALALSGVRIIKELPPGMMPVR